jgi:pyruvate kinase
MGASVTKIQGNDKELGSSMSTMYHPRTEGLSLAEQVKLITSDKGSRARAMTKLVCTMGPSCWDVEPLKKMMTIGMTVARLNFSHGDHETHGATVSRIREASAATGRPCAIMLDTKGPEIRTGFFAESGGKISLTAGQELKIVTDYDFKGDSSCIACTYKALPSSVSVGNQILIADGSLVCTVLSCHPDEGHVLCRVENNAKIGERKNMNLPGVKVDLPVLQPKDVADIANFGVPQGVDFVAASFVQSGEDVQIIRATLGEAGASIKIISKIENQEGLENFDAILEASDGIMVARGDLGMEIPPQQVFIAQKLMIARCNLAGKPVITATQMLESMTAAPRPTRAEVSDVANAVLDGTDCVMLSGETAGGDFPLEAVQTMVNTSMEAEKTLNFGSMYDKFRTLTQEEVSAISVYESVASSVCKTALESNAKAIIVVTDSERYVGMITKYRPNVPIVLATSDDQFVRQASGYMKNVEAFHLDSSAEGGFEAPLRASLSKAVAAGVIVAGDLVVATMRVQSDIADTPITLLVRA